MTLFSANEFHQRPVATAASSPFRPWSPEIGDNWRQLGPCSAQDRHPAHPISRTPFLSACSLNSLHRDFHFAPDHRRRRIDPGTSSFLRPEICRVLDPFSSPLPLFRFWFRSEGVTQKLASLDVEIDRSGPRPDTTAKPCQNGFNTASYWRMTLSRQGYRH